MNAVTGALALLGNPLLAAALGLALGVALLRLCRFGAGFFTADEPEIGMIRALVVNAGAMAIALAALVLYFVSIRPGFVAFGVGLSGGFMTATLFELFRSIAPKARYARR